MGYVRGNETGKNRKNSKGYPRNGYRVSRRIDPSYKLILEPDSSIHLRTPPRRSPGEFKILSQSHITEREWRTRYARTIMVRAYLVRHSRSVIWLWLSILNSPGERLGGERK